MGFTNEVIMMIRQRAISVKLDETDAAVTNLPGAAILANLADRLGLLQDLDSFPPAKERDRGLDSSAAVFDLMSIPLCIENLEQFRKDQGLERLLGRKVMVTSTAHDFLRRIRYDGLDSLAHVIVFSENHLRRVLADYVAYCNESRTHLSLEMDSPVTRPVQTPDQGKAVSPPKSAGFTTNTNAAPHSQ